MEKALGEHSIYSDTDTAKAAGTSELLANPNDLFSPDTREIS